MKKTILITGATDGIGLETAKALIKEGHRLLIHGRSQDKLIAANKALKILSREGDVFTYLADFSDLRHVASCAQQIIEEHDHIDVLINNAGVYKTPNPILNNGQDSRFVVNTLAPFLLSHLFQPLFVKDARIVNLSSAAQDTVNIAALKGEVYVDDYAAYAQSKLAITMWTQYMAASNQGWGQMLVAINPASLLASKMVKEGFGVAGKDIQVGVDILCRAALSDEFAEVNGQYYDNDIGAFTAPHEDAADEQKVLEVIETIEFLIGKYTQ